MMTSRREAFMGLLADIVPLYFVTRVQPGRIMEYLSAHYLQIKYLHILTAVLSILLFVSRFLLLRIEPDRRRRAWLKVLPHLNDSLLLLFAVLLCLAIQQAPLVTPWLTEKVTAVVVYILAGMFALKWAKSGPGQWIWFMIALFMFAYTANTAINKTPLIFQ
jgi:uncharacterized membrane protein SirB2